MTFVRDEGRTGLADTSLIKEHSRARLASSFSVLMLQLPRLRTNAKRSSIGGTLSLSPYLFSGANAGSFLRTQLRSFSRLQDYVVKLGLRAHVCEIATIATRFH